MVVTYIVFTQIAIFGLTDTAILIWYGKRNQTYKARRQWKIEILEQVRGEKERSGRFEVIKRGRKGEKVNISCNSLNRRKVRSAKFAVQL